MHIYKIYILCKIKDLAKKDTKWSHIVLSFIYLFFYMDFGSDQISHSVVSDSATP